MRIRSIKPEFWSDERLARLPILTRLFYIGLWNEADDAGRFIASPRRLLGVIFPFDEGLTEGSVSDSLNLLEGSGRIVLYSVNGTPYGEIVHFLRHQVINRPSKSRIPAPTAPGAVLRSLTEPSLNTHGGLTEGSLLGARSQELGARSQELGNRNADGVTLSGDDQCEVSGNVRQVPDPPSSPEGTPPPLPRKVQQGTGDSRGGQTTLLPPGGGALDGATGGSGEADRSPVAGAGDAPRSPARRVPRKPAPDLSACQPAIDLWRLICVPAGLPEVTPAAWSPTSLKEVAAAAADLPSLEALLRRTIANRWRCTEQRPSLLWVVSRRGREAILNGKTDAPSLASGSQRPPGHRPMCDEEVYDVPLYHLTPLQRMAVVRASMKAGNNRIVGAQLVHQWLDEHAEEVARG
jgi:hypothetical protein